MTMPGARYVDCVRVSVRIPREVHEAVRRAVALAQLNGETLALDGPDGAWARASLAWAEAVTARLPPCAAPPPPLRPGRRPMNVPALNEALLSAAEPSASADGEDKSS